MGTAKLYRAWTPVDRFDFGDEVLEGFTIKALKGRLHEDNKAS